MVSRFLVALACAALAACGGGGGGGSSGSIGGGGGAAPAQGLNLDQTALNWDIEEAETAGSLAITGAINGATEPVFLFVEHTDVAISSAQFELTGTTTGKLTVNPRPWSALQPGSYKDRVTVRACFDSKCTREVVGSPKTVDVNFKLRAAAATPALELSQYGVAFAKAPHGKRLTHNVKVRDTVSDTSAWTATSDAAWLSVTPSGTSGGNLTLTANEAGLAAGQHLASVTVRSDNPRVTGAQTLAVGLYVTRSARAAEMSQRPHDYDVDASLYGRAATMDPVRPVLYSTFTDRIVARHFYTGELLATWPLLGDTTSGSRGAILSLTVSDDGRELYALEQRSNSIHVIDLQRSRIDRSFSVAAVDGLFTNFNAGRIVFFRLNGRGMLLANDGPFPTIGVSTLLNPQTGAKEASLPLDGAGLHLLDLVPSVDGRFIYAGRSDGASRVLLQVRPAINAKGTVFARVVSVPGGSPRPMPGGGVMDGFDVFQSTDSALIAAPSPIREALNALTFHPKVAWALGSDGRMLIGTNPYFSEPGADIWLFRADGTLQTRWKDASFNSQAFLPSFPLMSLSISSDGLRAQSDYKLIDLPN